MSRKIKSFQEPSDCLHVGDLTSRHTKETLKELFEAEGENGRKVVKMDLKMVSNDPDSLLGYAFIKMDSVENAVIAMAELNGTMSFGRKLRVGWSSGNSIMVNVDPTVEALVDFDSRQINQVLCEDTLRELVGRYTQCAVADVVIKKIQICLNEGRYSGYAFIHFPRTAEGVSAVKLLAHTLSNVTLGGVVHLDFKVTTNLVDLLQRRPELETDINVTAAALNDAQKTRDKGPLKELELDGISFATQQDMKHHPSRPFLSSSHSGGSSPRHRSHSSASNHSPMGGSRTLPSHVPVSPRNISHSSSQQSLLPAALSRSSSGSSSVLGLSNMRYSPSPRGTPSPQPQSNDCGRDSSMYQQQQHQQTHHHHAQQQSSSRFRSGDQLSSYYQQAPPNESHQQIQSHASQSYPIPPLQQTQQPQQMQHHQTYMYGQYAPTMQPYYAMPGVGMQTPYYAVPPLSQLTMLQHNQLMMQQHYQQQSASIASQNQHTQQQHPQQQQYIYPPQHIVGQNQAVSLQQLPPPASQYTPQQQQGQQQSQRQYGQSSHWSGGGVPHNQHPQRQAPALNNSYQAQSYHQQQSSSQSQPSVVGRNHRGAASRAVSGLQANNNRQSPSPVRDPSEGGADGGPAGGGNQQYN